MGGSTGNFREWSTKSTTNTTMGGNRGNFRQWDPRNDPNTLSVNSSGGSWKSDSRTGGRLGATSSVTFVGTIESIDISNRTVEVSGRDSVVAVWHGQNLVYDSKSRSYVPDSRQVENRGTVNTKPTRTLEAAGKEETRTFEAGGFCHIETTEKRRGKMGVGMITLADLQVGQKVSVEFTTGIGGRYTAKSILPMESLNITPVDPAKTVKK